MLIDSIRAGALGLELECSAKKGGENWDWYYGQPVKHEVIRACTFDERGSESRTLPHIFVAASQDSIAVEGGAYAALISAACSGDDTLCHTQKSDLP